MLNKIKSEWNIEVENCCAVAEGLNRKTYRLNDMYWLTICNTEDEQRLISENSIYNSLKLMCSSENNYPQIIKTNNMDYKKFNKQIWRIITNIDGCMPDINDVGFYSRLGRCIGILHNDLKHIQNDITVNNLSICEQIKNNVLKYYNEPNSFEFNKNEKLLINRALNEFYSSVDIVNKTSNQLIHGDLTFPNIIAGKERIGFIDFEFSCFDSVLFDLASIYIALIVRTNMCKNSVDYAIKSLLENYSEVSNTDVNIELLEIASFLLKLDSCFYHKMKNKVFGEDYGITNRQFEQLKLLYANKEID